MIAKLYSTNRLVKGEDLNHHGTLFAGRTAEWFVESGFIAVSSYLNPRNIVCLKIHGMTFKYPVKGGDSICFESKLAYVGKSSMIVLVRVYNNKSQQELVSGFISFVHVDENTRPAPHGIELKFENEADRKIAEAAAMLPK
ncbi:MAG: hotdog domain-containing protein [Bacteroidales bacterium]|nr:hotdog domain-containing protein [Bacteroidales bacterium]